MSHSSLSSSVPAASKVLPPNVISSQYSPVITTLPSPRTIAS
jgi:hypothetical protein